MGEHRLPERVARNKKHRPRNVKAGDREPHREGRIATPPPPARVRNSSVGTNRRRSRQRHRTDRHAALLLLEEVQRTTAGRLHTARRQNTGIDSRGTAAGMRNNRSRTASIRGHNLGVTRRTRAKLRAFSFRDYFAKPIVRQQWVVGLPNGKVWAGPYKWNGTTFTEAEQYYYRFGSESAARAAVQGCELEHRIRFYGCSIEIKRIR